MAQGLRPGHRRGGLLIVLGLVAAALTLAPAAGAQSASRSNVTATVARGDPPLWEVTLSDAGGLDGTYTGWCHDPMTPLETITYHNVPLSLLDDGAVNWIINQPWAADGHPNTCDAQMAIWLLVYPRTAGQTDEQILDELAPECNRVDRAVALSIRDEALRNQGFRPACGQYEGLVISPAGAQELVLARPKTCLKLIKQVRGGEAVPSDWTLSAAGPTLLQGPGPTVTSGPVFPAGTYRLSESTGPADYSAGDWVCRGGTQVDGATVTLAPGDSATCTIRNTWAFGRIIIQKATIPAGAAPSFEFDPSWTGPNFSLADGESHDSGLLPAGTYWVAEATPLPDGWFAQGATCDDGSTANAIHLGAGETVTCTFTNSEGEIESPQASLTIVKEAAAADGIEFPFDGTLGPFTLADGQSQTFADLEPGEYQVAEQLPAGWQFDRVECVGGEWVAGDASVSVTLQQGEPAQCTFYNTQEQQGGPGGSLTIVKRTEPAGGTGFSFEAGSLGSFMLSDDGSKLFSGLDAGEYTVTETDAGELELSGVLCNAGDWEASANGVTVRLAEGEAAVCTFYNGGELPYTGLSFLWPFLLAGGLVVAIGLVLVLWPLRRRHLDGWE